MDSWIVPVQGVEGSAACHIYGHGKAGLPLL